MPARQARIYCTATLGLNVRVSRGVRHAIPHVILPRAGVGSQQIKTMLEDTPAAKLRDVVTTFITHHGWQI